MTYEEKIRKQISEMPIDNLIFTLETHVIKDLPNKCDCCINNRICNNMTYYNRPTVEMSCGMGIHTFLKQEVK